MADPASSVTNQGGLTQVLTEALNGATIRGRLTTGTGLTAASVPGDIAANELSGNGYPAGGVTLTFVSAAWDAADSRAETAEMTALITPSGGDLTWRQITITVNNGTEYIWSTQNWAADETASDGVPYSFRVKLTLGGQGTSVDIVDT